MSGLELFAWICAELLVIALAPIAFALVRTRSLYAAWWNAYGRHRLGLPPLCRCGRFMTKKYWYAECKPCDDARLEAEWQREKAIERAVYEHNRRIP